MVGRDVMRAPASVSITLDLAGEFGVSPERCLRGTGLRAEDVHHVADQPDGRLPQVSPAQELGVIANLLEATGDRPGLGLEAGLRYHLTTYGIWGFAMVSSPTLREAVSVGLRFLELTFSFCRISLSESGDEARLALSADDVPAHLRRFAIERDAAAIMVIQRELLGMHIPLRRLVIQAFPIPEDEAELQRYADIFGLLPESGDRTTYAAFDRDLLDWPLPQADPWTTAAAQQQCRALLESRRARSGQAGRVRDAILDHLGEGASVAAVADDLHQSTRSLQRALAAEGTSYRALLEEVRQGMAREMLGEGGMTVAEVARRLGYTELTSFSQAFRRWEGMSPRQFRR